MQHLKGIVASFQESREKVKEASGEGECSTAEPPVRGQVHRRSGVVEFCEGAVDEGDKKVLQKKKKKKKSASWKRDLKGSRCAQLPSILNQKGL